ncbi:MAG: formate/nitrite transporter family protein [Clostridia bacterium]|nr:formate/nitrite transporter family protein [Clostridia bacterium]
MKGREILKLCVYSIFAGICIAFSALLFLYASSLSDGEAVSKAICSLLFSFGLFFIIVMEYKLFTGMVAGLADMKPKQWFDLVICYVFNTVGILIIVVIFKLFNNSVSKAVFERSVTVMTGKLSSSMLGSFFSAVCCGMMITFAVKANGKAVKKGLSGTLCILFPVLMFIFMGFEHSIADQVYIFLAVLGGAEMDPVRVLLFAATVAFGNVVGGVFFPLLRKIAEKVKGEKEAEKAEEVKPE